VNAPGTHIDSPWLGPPFQDGNYHDKKGATVFGIGRPSIVDFEEHEYASHAVPSAYQKMSLEEIRSLAKKHGKKSKAARTGVLKPR